MSGGGGVSYILGTYRERWLVVCKWATMFRAKQATKYYKENCINLSQLVYQF